MAKKNNSTTMDITGFEIDDMVNAAIDANGVGDSTEQSTPVKKTLKPNNNKQKEDTELSSNLPELPKNFQDKFFDNIFSYDRSPDRGKPVYISSALLQKLQELSEKHYRRISVRTLVQSVLETFMSYDADKAVSDFLKKINFKVPTDKELEVKKKAAKKARERRASDK